MVGVHHSDDSLKAVGITSKEKRLEFDCMDGELHCYNQDLVSLDIPEGVKKVCCSNNLLTQLVIPEGIIYVYCWGNQLTELKIPNSIKEICCDRNVLGLDKIDWDCHIKLY